ncbi:UDP-2,3-diacylglucosamine diphosphatase [Akkermansia muciniphila]|uniref:UDP-2,3-diacylglucosamine diphosphatase n=1 Tax=Akkermansia muciniphila TaxID=239935 RepID=UPI0031B899BE
MPCWNAARFFLSDLHLGTKDCKADECRKFLKHVRAGKIVLVGDIVDAWALSRGSRWRRRHTRFVRTLLKKMEQEDVEVLYLRGNHDDILEKIPAFSSGRFENCQGVRAPGCGWKTLPVRAWGRF